MAEPITYDPPPAIPDGGRAQVDDFVAALDESGLLRAATGAVRTYPDIAALLVRRLDPESVRALVALGGMLKDLDADRTEQVVGGARSAASAAGEAARSAEAPSLFQLVRQLGDPDVRRAAGSLLAGLKAFGRSMRAG